MRSILIGLLVLTFYALTVWADGTEVDVIEGNTVVPVMNDNIRMVSEEVRMFEELQAHQIETPSAIPFIKKKEEVYTSKGMKVVAIFVFENETDKQASIKIGFPYYKGNGPSNFNVWIQDKPVRVDQGQMGERDTVVIKNKNGLVFDAYIWDVSFSAHEQKKIKVEYYGGWGAPVYGNPYTYFIYITKTGALWHGNIGRADFYLKLTKSATALLKRKDFKLSIKPGNYILRDDQIEWHFKDWEPAENIGVALIKSGQGGKEFEEELRESEQFKVLTREEFLSEEKAFKILLKYFNEKEYDGNMRRYDSSDLDTWKQFQYADDDMMHRLYIKALRNEIFARHGRFFNSVEIRKIFESTGWYKRNTSFRESELNEMEKRNIDFIFEYEKKMGWK